MMQQGISSLPGAQGAQGAPQAPGQAPMPQAVPPKQGVTPQAVTSQLDRLPPQQLLAMFANPGDATPKWAVVSAYAKAIENQRLMAAAQGQAAMQQNQMQQGQPPVAAQVMSQGLPALPGAQSFSGGGAVAFAGGNPTLARLPGETDEEYAQRQQAAVSGGLFESLPEESWLRKASNWLRAGRPSLERPLLDITPPSAPKTQVAPDTYKDTRSDIRYPVLTESSNSPLAVKSGATSTNPFSPPPEVAIPESMAPMFMGTDAESRASAPEDFDKLVRWVKGKESSGRQFDASGKTLESVIIDPKTGERKEGAMGIMQVMRGTGPEAAKLAGLPWDEKKWLTDASYNEALGRAYLAKQISDFGGDVTKALAAYNFGPPRVKAAIEKAGPEGNWFAAMPKETKDYVARIASAYGGTGAPEGIQTIGATKPSGGGQPSGISPTAAASAGAPTAGTYAPATAGIASVLPSALPPIDPETKAALDALRAQSESVSARQAEAAQALSKPGEAEIASREAFRKAMADAYAPQQKAAEAARAQAERSPFFDPVGISQIAAAAAGAKRFGQGLGAAVGAGGAYMGEQRKRADALEAEYNRLESQRKLLAAQAAHADAVGDEKLRTDSIRALAGIEKEKFGTALELQKITETARVQQPEGIAKLGQAQAALMGAQAHAATAAKLSDFQQRVELYKKDPKAYEAMFGDKQTQAIATVQKAIEADPKLKSLAAMAGLSAEHDAAYNKRYRELLLMYAPDMVAGASTPPPGAVREKGKS